MLWQTLFRVLTNCHFVPWRFFPYSVFSFFVLLISSSVSSQGWDFPFNVQTWPLITNWQIKPFFKNQSNFGISNYWPILIATKLFYVFLDLPLQLLKVTADIFIEDVGQPFTKENLNYLSKCYINFYLPKSYKIYVVHQTVRQICSGLNKSD